MAGIIHGFHQTQTFRLVLVAANVLDMMASLPARAFGSDSPLEAHSVVGVYGGMLHAANSIIVRWWGGG